MKQIEYVHTLSEEVHCSPTSWTELRILMLENGRCHTERNQNRICGFAI